jgi:hypothetical protein
LEQSFPGPDAVAILAIAPTPAKGRSLSKTRIETALRKAGRRRLLDERVNRITRSCDANNSRSRRS